MARENLELSSKHLCMVTARMKQDKEMDEWRKHTEMSGQRKNVVNMKYISHTGLTIAKAYLPLG